MNRILLFALFLITFSSSFGQSLPDLIDTYRADKGALERKYNNHLSQEAFDRMQVFYADWLSSLNSLDFDKLQQSQKVDFVLLRNLIEKNQNQHSIDYALFNEVKDVSNQLGVLYDFVKERSAGKNPNSEKLAADFHEAEIRVRKQFEEHKKAKKYNSWQKAELASNTIAALKKSSKEAFLFYDGYNPSFMWWVKTPFNKLMKTLEEYEKFLKDHFENTLVKDDGSGIIGKPIGRKAILKELEYEFIPYTPEELITEANKQFAWCEKEMLKASEELGYGKDWKKALEHVKNTYVPPGQWQEDVNKFAHEAIGFLQERDLITIPPLAIESFRTIMISAERQKVSPFFLGGEVIQVAYPTDEMEHEDKMMSMRGNNPHFSHATIQHELIPGHHLQQFMNKRNKTYRQGFYTPFWMEGWALYWELNLWDKGFSQSPEDKIGMLFWRMHRCARIIFSLNYHLEKMTPQECIDLLVNKVGHERANAEAEVRRSFTGGYGPLYQIAYMMGGLQFYNLKKQLVDTGKMSEKAFHDIIMQNNAIPVEMVRAILLNEEVSKDRKSEWRFLD
ncbi:protein of unknown function [Spirosomataceae bacterium TFI 002]|nr:protein of unknown function [Spirosomataceae bacterium TFI 002]